LRAAILLAMLVLASEARASDDWKVHFLAGVEAYKAGIHYRSIADQERATASFKRAVAEYEKSHELEPRPETIFSLAQARRALGDLERALDLYREYLRQEPSGQWASAARKLVPELREQIDRKAATTISPPTGTPTAAVTGRTAPPASPMGVSPPTSGPMTGEPSPSHVAPSVTPNRSPITPVTPPPPPIEAPNRPRFDNVATDPGRTKRHVGLGLAISGGVLVVVGAVMFGLAQIAANDATATGTYDPFAEDRKNTFVVVGAALVAVGGIAAIAGVSVYVVGKRSARRLSLAPTVTHQGASLALEIKF
jgi:hypothetical protein